MKKEKKGSVRVASFEITKLDKDAYRRWLVLSDMCRGIINATWQTWLVWHVQNHSEEKLKAHFKRFNEWKAADKATRGEKPKWPVVAVPKECAKATYDEVARRFQDIETTCREQCRNSVIQKIGSLKAANGSLPGWVAILFCMQSLPSTVRGNPIPFSKKNAEIEPPKIAPGSAAGKKNDSSAELQQWKLHLKLTRVPPVAGKKCGSTVLETVNLWSLGRKAAGQVAILRKIMSGEYEFCGSSMVFSSSKKKWFAKICFRQPAGVENDLDEGRVAYLRPSSVYSAIPHPWRLRFSETNRWPGGLAPHVAHVRRTIVAQRRSRQNNYRFSGSSNKGHGRNRALQPIWTLTQRWKDFVKTFNYTVCKDVVQQCVERGYGTLVYFQPTGPIRESRFLNCTGKAGDIDESTGWDWFQVRSRLETLCQEAGIKLVVRKSGETGEWQPAEVA